jgi:hypothetical protein
MSSPSATLRERDDVEKSPLPSPRLDGTPKELPLLNATSNSQASTAGDERIPLKYRMIALSMILFFSTGSSYLDAVISPLKSTLRKELSITSESTVSS